MSEIEGVAVGQPTDEPYEEFEQLIRSRVAGVAGAVFETTVPRDHLWHAYLSGFPASRQQRYRCQTCRQFFQRYGGLVTIDDSGDARSVLWNVDPPAFFRPSVHRLRTLVKASAVTGVFLSAAAAWGVPTKGPWTHLSGTAAAVYTAAALTADQAMAEKRADFEMLDRGVADYPRAAVDQALRVLGADALARSEKAVGVAEWFADLHARVAANPPRRDNLIWAAVAAAPPGFCHVRSSMIGTLLDDVVAGLTFADVARRWAAKMHPLRYQRPTAAPSAKTFEQAEKLVAKLGVARSLDRRFARLEDVLAKAWVPRPAAEPAGGVFGHLRPKSARAVGTTARLDLPRTAITWAKFARTVLPDALAVDVQVPAKGQFYGLITAADPTAPPILQWDGLAGRPRNPASLYVYHGGSACSQWGLTAGWSPVATIFLSPHRWQEPDGFAHHGQGVCFAIDGCRDGGDAARRGLALFPEQLKAEFHGIRSVIETHSKAGVLSAEDGGTANGLLFVGGHPVTLDVRTAGGLAMYLVDRSD